MWEGSEWCGRGMSGMGEEGVVWEGREWCGRGGSGVVYTMYCQYGDGHLVE